MNEIRKKRLESRLLHLMADLYFKELKNPKIGYATFTRCNLANDQSKVEFFVSVLGSKHEKYETLNALKSARGFIRAKIRKNVRMRSIPQVYFVEDPGLENSASIEQLIENSGRDQSESDSI